MDNKEQLAIIQSMAENELFLVLARLAILEDKLDMLELKLGVLNQELE